MHRAKFYPDYQLWSRGSTEVQIWWNPKGMSTTQHIIHLISEYQIHRPKHRGWDRLWKSPVLTSRGGSWLVHISGHSQKRCSNCASTILAYPREGKWACCVTTLCHSAYFSVPVTFVLLIFVSAWMLCKIKPLGLPSPVEWNISRHCGSEQSWTLLSSMSGLRRLSFI